MSGRRVAIVEDDAVDEQQQGHVSSEEEAMSSGEDSASANEDHFDDESEDEFEDDDTEGTSKKNKGKKSKSKSKKKSSSGGKKTSAGAFVEVYASAQDLLDAVEEYQARHGKGKKVGNIVEQPQELKAVKMRDYQVEGLKWMADLHQKVLTPCWGIFFGVQINQIMIIFF